MINIAITGGGTGGHIYPGLAVAFELKNLIGAGLRLFWIGSSSGMDRGIVEEAGIEFFGVPSGKLRRYFSFRNAADFFKVIAGFFAARKIFKKEKPGLLFSKGGFVSVPSCAAAFSLNIPVFTHESDFSPGLATKIITRFVKRGRGKIFVSYEETLKFLPRIERDRVTVCGNPVRPVFRNASAARGRAFLEIEEERRLILVLGGSQGASAINELVRAALNELTETYTVIHQTGPALKWDLGPCQKYKPFSYIKDEMADVMAACEIVAGRSGAGIWEWAALGKPMILIPLSGPGTRGDQVENAAYFKNRGAALALSGVDANPEAFAGAVRTLSRDAEKREAMAAASLEIGKKNGAQIIARAILEVERK